MPPLIDLVCIINCVCAVIFYYSPPCKCRSLWTCVHYLTSQMLDKVYYRKSLALFPCRVWPCCWAPGVCWLGLSVSYLMSILTGQPGRTTSCRSWKSVFVTVWSRL